MKSEQEVPFSESSDFAGAFALLAEMSRDFADTLEIESTLERALAMIAEHLHAEAGSLWLLDEGGTELECKASVGPHPITGMRLSVDKGIIGTQHPRERLSDGARRVQGPELHRSRWTRNRGS